MRRAGLSDVSSSYFSYVATINDASARGYEGVKVMGCGSCGIQSNHNCD
jgi:hypothetical protein